MNESQLIRKSLREGEAIVRRNERLISAVDKALKESNGRTLSQLDKIKLGSVIENTTNLLMLKEDDSHTEVYDIADKQEFLNLVVCTWAKSTLPFSTMTFSMKQRVSEVFYLAYKYGSNKGGISAGDEVNKFDRYWVESAKVDAASKYASEEVEGETVGAVAATDTYTFEFTPIAPGTISIADGNDTYVDDGEGHIHKEGATTTLATVDYETGVLTSTTLALTAGEATYAYDNTICPVEVPQLKLEVTPLTLTAKAYTLGYTYSTFAAFNLLRSQNVDLKDLLNEGTANELVQEIDNLVYADFVKAANANALGVTFNFNYTGYFSQHEYYQGFGDALQQASQLVFQKTRKVRPNVAIVGINGGFLARQLDGFTNTEAANETGTHVIGNYRGITIIENPFFDADTCILTYKANDFQGAAAVGEYMPVIQTQLLQYEDFRNSSSLASMIAKKVITNNFFAKITITHN